MPFLLKLALTNLIIVSAAQIGKRYPSLAGLIATMPLTSLLVLLWLSSAHPSHEFLVRYVKGALWGIVPSIGFFVAALFCFERRLPLSIVLLTSFAVWLGGALLHRWILG
jgi:uncharacterized membrane protein (GlpM family)